MYCIRQNDIPLNTDLRAEYTVMSYQGVEECIKYLTWCLEQQPFIDENDFVGRLIVVN